MTTVSSNLLKSLIEHSLHSLWEDPQACAQMPALMIWGAPGVGKSSVILDVACKHDIPVIDVRLAQREPVDMRGLPVPGEDSVRWLISDEWPRDPDSRGIIFFDELTAADRTLQAAAYELILDRKLGADYNVPKGWLIVAAGNRSTDRAVAYSMSSALSNRFCHVTLEAKLDSWVQWGHSNGMHPDVLGFLRFRPELLFKMEGATEQGWPSPRSWHRVSTMISSLEDKGMNDSPLIDVTVAGLVGPAAALEFKAFRKYTGCGDVARKALLENHQVRFPDRADERYAYTSALLYHLLQKEEAILTLWPRFLQIIDHMSPDFGTLAITDAIASAPGHLAEEMLLDPKYLAWSAKTDLVMGASEGTMDFNISPACAA